MLLPEQVAEFLQHDDPIVRDHVLAYFRDSYDFGPLTAEHYWAVIDRFGENDDTLRFAAALARLPQTDASLHRLVAAIAHKPSSEFSYHYQQCAKRMDLSLLLRNRAELMDAPHLAPGIRGHLEMRLKLLDEAPASAWQSLLEYGREIAANNSDDFDYEKVERLVEAAHRGGAAVCGEALSLLSDPSAIEDWRAIFAVRVLGAARYEPAINAIVNLLAIDADVLREETVRALSRIGTREVIERILAFYPGKRWHVRLYAHNIPAQIKRPESEAAMLTLLNIETALRADPNYHDESEPLETEVMIGLTELCSLAALEQSRAAIAKSPEDPESETLCEGLLATAIMTGVELPEAAAWRKMISGRQARMARAMARFEPLAKMFLENKLKTEGSSNVTSVFREETSEHTAASMKPIRNAQPKVGRNDPCPCGSGKKYKKCCGK